MQVAAGTKVQYRSRSASPVRTLKADPATERRALQRSAELRARLQISPAEVRLARSATAAQLAPQAVLVMPCAQRFLLVPCKQAPRLQFDGYLSPVAQARRLQAAAAKLERLAFQVGPCAHVMASLAALKLPTTTTLWPALCAVS